MPTPPKFLQGPLLALLCLLAASLSVPAQAQPAAVPRPAAEIDTMAQRMQACTLCHGPQGRAAADGYYPRIAGKPAGYLFNQLQNFRDGRRRYGLMTGLLAPLDDHYLQEMAQYFAALDLPYPPQPPTRLSAEVRARGEQLVHQGDASRQIPACAACHGSQLTGVAPAIPGLLGLPRDYLNAQLGSWRTGSRRAHAPDCMAKVAQQLAPDDVSAVAQWLAAQPLPASPRPLASLAALPAPLPLPCGGVAP